MPVSLTNPRRPGKTSSAALDLILQELAAAKLKYPHFADSLEQALVALASEQGELATAILRRDIHGKHGVVREAAQVAAVAIRIIEMSLGEVERG